jgi:hypothetical protein
MGYFSGRGRERIGWTFRVTGNRRGQANQTRYNGFGLMQLCA